MLHAARSVVWHSSSSSSRNHERRRCECVSRCRLQPIARAGQGREWEEMLARRPRERGRQRACTVTKRGAYDYWTLAREAAQLNRGGHWLPAVITLLLALVRDATTIVAGLSRPLAFLHLHRSSAMHVYEGHELWTCKATPCMCGSKLTTTRISSDSDLRAKPS